MAASVLIMVGVLGVFAAFVPAVRSLRAQREYGRRLQHLSGRERRVLTSAFLARRPIPAHQATDATTLARLYWLQRYLLVSNAALGVMFIGLATVQGSSGATTVGAVLGLVAVVAGSVVIAAQAVAGRRFLGRRGMGI